MKTYIVIPARYQSSRLPGKPLADIAGKPMIQRVYEQAQKSKADRVIIATDDDRIINATKTFNGEACLTATTHQSGTERIAEVIDQLDIAGDDLIINIQGDEPFIPPALINQVIDRLAIEKTAKVATLCEKIQSANDLFNPNINKVIIDKNGYAIYFSRAPIPYYRDGFSDKKLPEHYDYYRHIGIYGYRAAFVKQYISWPPSPIEKIECLEQLRVLYYGEKIAVDIATEAPGIGIDTPEDLERARKIKFIKN
jgi:3-deoxy-manno-octulosonate cytidylyltransferase (CMP-KDO synthetase)